MAKSNDRAQVIARLRPKSKSEQENGVSNAWKIEGGTSIVEKVPKRKKPPKKYDFDRVFNGEETTQFVYENSACKETVAKALLGESGCILGYGQTSSGKTHTLVGSADGRDGVVQLAFADMQAKSGHASIIHLSILEVYNKNVYDLFSKERKAIANKCDGGKIANKCDGGTRVHVPNSKALNEALQKAMASRICKKTKLNDTSSRSHCLLMFDIRSQATPLEKENQGLGNLQVRACRAKLAIVDLAGSERMYDGKEDGLAKEGIAINRSLLELRRCISAIANGNARVPYDDVLPNALKPYFSGDGNITTILCAAPGDPNVTDTKQTFDFGSDCKKVKTCPKQKIVLADRSIFDSNEDKGISFRQETMHHTVSLSEHHHVVSEKERLQSECEKLRQECGGHESVLSQKQQLEHDLYEAQRMLKAEKTSGYEKDKARVELQSEVDRLRQEYQSLAKAEARRKERRAKTNKTKKDAPGRTADEVKSLEKEIERLKKEAQRRDRESESNFDRLVQQQREIALSNDSLVRRNKLLEKEAKEKYLRFCEHLRIKDEENERLAMDNKRLAMDKADLEEQMRMGYENATKKIERFKRECERMEEKHIEEVEGLKDKIKEFEDELNVMRAERLRRNHTRVKGSLARVIDSSDDDDDSIPDLSNNDDDHSFVDLTRCDDDE